MYQESNTLNEQMSSYFSSEDLLYAKAGLQPLDHSVRAMGTGGEVLPEERFKRFISRPLIITRFDSYRRLWRLKTGNNDVFCFYFEPYFLF